jgi:hypothetical protein
MTTMLQMNALGLLLTFATTPWYASGGPPPFGLTDLEDQQLGALIMWMLGGMVYAGVALQVVWAILSDRDSAEERLAAR